MKLIIFAFILSLTIHILLFAPFFKQPEESKQNPSSLNQAKKQVIKYVRIISKPVQKSIIKKELVKPKKIKKPEIKKVFKKVEKSKIIPHKKNKIWKKSKKSIPKPIKKIEVRPTYTQLLPRKIEIKPQEKRKSITKRSLENFLLSEPVPLDINMLDTITKKYIKLYGEEYNSFTKVQKVYLQKNLKNIGRITQKYLKYPNIAVRTGQDGMNIVEFFLHPNGDISRLKLTSSSGFTSLDKNSIETIEIAYKDYPRPKTKTKVKIYVYYKLY